MLHNVDRCGQAPFQNLQHDELNFVSITCHLRLSEATQTSGGTILPAHKGAFIKIIRSATCGS